MAKEAARPSYAFIFSQLSDLNSFQIRRASQLQTEYMRLHKAAQSGGEGEAVQQPAGEPHKEDAAELPLSPSGLGSEPPSHAHSSHPSSEPLQPPAEGVDVLSEDALDAQLRALDDHVGRIHNALPANTLLLLATGQGNTAECRRQQELKYKRQGRVDGLPAWTLRDEDAYAERLNREIQGLCFCHVKQSAVNNGSAP